MIIPAGTQFGAYEIVALIGSGGMGEVYRARDRRLDREVAVKLLARAVANHPDRLERFRREAHLLAGLNHPNIAHVYGLEDLSPDELSGALVMELVEGPTLADRLTSGPVPVDEAVPLARQIADAIEFAHDHGIIHRDLKPANIKLRPDGTVKVLDFGLAKALDPFSRSDADLTSSPTLLANQTAAGVILGTAGYMAPEQARGRVVDRRVDVWAFGAVLFEMLSGRRAFDGASVTDILAAVIDDDPPWAALPATTPPALIALLRRCLERDPRQRLRDIGEARIALEHARPVSGSANARGAASETRQRLWRALPWALTAATVAIALAFVQQLERTPPPTGPLQFSIRAPTPSSLPRQVLSPVLAVAPDGRRMALATVDGMFLWTAETGDWQLLGDTAGAIAPFFSPDGLHIGFFDGDELRRIPVAGGPASLVTRAPAGNAGTWGRDGTILYNQWLGADDGLWRVEARGGQSHLLVPAGNPMELRAFPSFLPDSRHYLFMRSGGPVGQRDICIGSIEAGTAKCVAKGDSNAMYAAGHLIFVRAGALVALPFDVDRQQTAGEAITLARTTRWFGPLGIALFGVSADGRVLVHAPAPAPHRLVWMDQAGREIGLLGAPAPYGVFELSPDEKRLAVEIWNDGNGGRDIWVIDVASGVPTRLTFDPIDSILGAWAPDGRALAISQPTPGPPDIVTIGFDGQPPQMRLQRPGVQLVQDWQTSEGVLAYLDFSPDRAAVQVWLAAAEGEPRRFRETPANSWDARFSPDGQSLAFASDESGMAEVYVAPVDRPGEHRRWSRAGGFMPRWRGDGGELFFLQRDGMLTAIEVLATGMPRPLFRVDDVTPADAGQPGRERSVVYAVARDGQRLLLRSASRDAGTHVLRVRLDWHAARD